MVFFNPKTDLAFKKIFGSEQSQEVLRSLLNGIVFANRPSVTALEIVDPYQAPRLKGLKDSYLDVKVRLEDGTRVIVEMQCLNFPGFEKRVLYNAAKAYSMQLGSGTNYRQISPVIALSITDFVMFEDGDC